MLAARLHKIGEPMRLEHVPVPRPRPTDVLVVVKACGVVPNLINVLTHWQIWFPEPPLPKLPAIFGLDVAGEIASVGEQVQNFRKGDTPGLFCGTCPACRADDTMNCANFTFRGYFGFGPGSQRQFDAYPYGGMCEYITAPQLRFRVKALAPDRNETLAEDEGKSAADWARSFTGGHGVDAVIDYLAPGTSGTPLMNAIYALRRGWQGDQHRRCWRKDGHGRALDDGQPDRIHRQQLVQYRGRRGARSDAATAESPTW
jgi:Alcohol dehydrogenase GroES-like domain